MQIDGNGHQQTKNAPVVSFSRKHRGFSRFGDDGLAKKETAFRLLATSIVLTLYEFQSTPARGVRPEIHGLSHGLKIARQLSIFTPVCALVPPFQVPLGIKNTDTQKVCLYFLVREAGLEPACPE
ncbi:MAG: hypothetical protein E7437_06885 [Ruminococcaceae bacterium]|nr:hypothetical protein [Oscillospiraceae bacterium]